MRNFVEQNPNSESSVGGNSERNSVRKQTIVRRRATNFILALLKKGYCQIPVEKAKDIFSEETGYYDRSTIKAYFGTQAHTSTKKIRRLARYGTGTFSIKDIELTHKTTTKPGYLEKLGLVTFELRGKTWFLKINEKAVLIPQLYERKQLFTKNISLSPNRKKKVLTAGGEEQGKTLAEFFSFNSKLETNNNLQVERERNLLTNSYTKS